MVQSFFNKISLKIIDIRLIPIYTSAKNRIIKVHGTLRKEDRKEEYGFDNDRYTQYIISKEDYEEYPKKHEAFKMDISKILNISIQSE